MYFIPVHAQENDDTLVLDTITVTASKREQSLQSIDGAVSVLPGETLEQRNILTVNDLEKVLPGLKIDARGNRAYANFTVRGVSSPDYYNPGVQVYVDGIPQPSSAMVQDLVDVERVEFLRGPQGTLYGRNAYAGVINIISRKPEEQRLSLSGTASNRLFDAGAATTAVVVPDSLYLDAAVTQRHDRGQIRDIDRADRLVDWSNTFSGRLALRYQPLNGPLDAGLWVSHEALRSREETYILDQDVRGRRYRSGLLGSYNLLDREMTTVGARASYRFGDFTLSGHAGYQDVSLDRRIFGGDYPESDRGFTGEAKLTYDAGGALTGVAGVSFWSSDFTRETGGYPGYYGPSHNAVDSRSVAAFGEATYALTDRLDVTAGARVSYDRASIDFHRLDSYGTGMGLDFDRSADFTSFQPKLSLGYQVSDTARIYALVSRGYKPGGFNHAVSYAEDALPYKSETAWNFEMGGRAALFDGKLDLSAAVYHIRSQDKQIYVGPAWFQVLRNAGDAESTGIEVEATVRPTDRLTLTATGAFGRSEFSNMTDPFTGQRYDGKRVPYAPDATGNLSLRYDVEQNVIPARMTLTAAAHLVGKTWFNEANTLSQSAYATFDAGLELAFDQGLTVRLFADNIADTTYRTMRFDYNGSTLNTIGQGRVIGMSMRTQF
ncbi:TonB-dependent receptor [Pseudochelatococcus sp. B33]